MPESQDGPPSIEPVNATSPQQHSKSKGPEPPSGTPPPASQANPPQNGKSYRQACRPDQTPWWKHLLEGCALLIALWVALIYHGQLTAMQGQLQQMEGSSKQTDRLLCLYQQQLAQLTNQATDTHALTIQAKNQADRTKEIAETSRDALVQVQRAVMTVTTVDVTRQGGQDGKITSLLLFVRWKNVGGTPTKNLTFRHNYWAGGRFPDNFVYHDLPDPNGTNTDTPSFAAPQGLVSALPITISIGTAQDIVDHKSVLTLWGHADYWDVFRGTPRHVTEYCSVITGFYGNIYSANPAETTIPVAENCKTYNCHDEECKNK